MRSHTAEQVTAILTQAFRDALILISEGQQAAIEDRLRSLSLPAKSEPDSLLKPEEAAGLLAVKVRTIYQLVADEKIPYRKVGSALRFQRQELLDWSAEQAKVKRERKPGRTREVSHDKMTSTSEAAATSLGRSNYATKARL